MNPNFTEFFQAATGHEPYEYQTEMADTGLPDLLRADTSAGKTAGVVLSWLYHRHHTKIGHQRLIWCVPMRTLVTQATHDIEAWIQRLNEQNMLTSKVSVHVLVGGDVDQTWRDEPDQDIIVIGTLDMLLSRAIGIGFGVPFRQRAVDLGLILNNSQWVYDEIQLFGVAKETTAALDVWKNSLDPAIGSSMWVSATLPQVDIPNLRQTQPSSNDSNPTTPLGKRIHATKTLNYRPDKDATDITDIVQQNLEEIGGNNFVLVIANTVRRATNIATELRNKIGDTNVTLLHSRFRQPDREQALDNITNSRTQVVVATQVIEAGVDISAAALITEIAPWSSLIQRFGRANRTGTYSHCPITVVGLGTEDGNPYSQRELEHSANQLNQIGHEGSLSPYSLRSHDTSEPPITVSEQTVEQIRQSVIEAVSGGSHDNAGALAKTLIRGNGYPTISVLWRTPQQIELSVERTMTHAWMKPQPHETVDAPAHQARKHATHVTNNGTTCWRLSHEGSSRYPRWEQVKNINDDLPDGSTVLFSTKDGGYTPTNGFIAETNNTVPTTDAPPSRRPNGFIPPTPEWLPLTTHLRDAEFFANKYFKGNNVAAYAALTHDLGKSHHRFQQFIRSGKADNNEPKQTAQYAKSGYRYGTAKPSLLNGLRHEFFSWILLTQTDTTVDPAVSYGILTHHGKIDLTQTHPAKPPLTRPGEIPPTITIYGLRFTDRKFIEHPNPIIDREFNTPENIEKWWQTTGANEWQRVRTWIGNNPLLAANQHAAVRIADWKASTNPRASEQ